MLGKVLILALLAGGCVVDGAAGPARIGVEVGPVAHAGAANQVNTGGAAGAAGAKIDAGATAGQGAGGATAGQGAGGATAGQSAGGATAGQSAGGATAGQSAGGATAGQGAGGATAGQGGATVSYSTNFPLNESRILEGGAWRQLQTDHKTAMASSGGVAYGTQGARPDTHTWNDSYAFINPSRVSFSPNQRVTVTVHKAPNLDPSCSHEIELLLRFDDASGPNGLVRGYEAIVSGLGTYAEIVSWESTSDGDLSNFHYLTGPGGNGVPVSDGDQFKAEVIGDVISLYRRVSGNWSLIVQATDTRLNGHARFTGGQPGIGAYRGRSGCGVLGDYGIQSFLAESF